MKLDGSGTGDAPLDSLVNLFQLLSDRTRMNILLVLARGERNVGGLCEQLRVPQPTVSHHLGLLRVANLIGNRRAGKQVFYHLDPRSVGYDRGTLRFTIAGVVIDVRNMF